MEILKKLSHSMLPQMVDYVQEGGSAYLVMEYIQGKTLEEIRKKGPCTREQAAAWGILACQVLKYLHSRYPAVLHLDVKPSNFILTDQGELYLIDLGSCLLMEGKAWNRKTCMGTLPYAPPEQIQGKPEPASDLYSLGKTLEVLVGGRARAGEELWAVLKKSQQPRPKQRYKSAAQMEQALKKAAGRRTSAAGRLGKAAAVLVMFLLLGQRLFLGTSENVPPQEEPQEKDDFLETYTEVQNQILKGITAGQDGQDGRKLLDSAAESLENLISQKLTERGERMCLLDLARVYRELGETEKAKETYEKLLQKELSVRTASEYGIYLLKLGERERSLEWHDLLQREEKTEITENYEIWEGMLHEKK